MDPAAGRPTTPFEPFGRAAIEQSIPERFQSRVRRHPDRLALAFGSVALSYEALNRTANRIAHAVLERRGAEEELVALAIRQGPTLVAAILGALKAGKVYVPLEATWPTAYLGGLIAESGAGLVLADRSGAEALAGLGTAEVLSVEALDPAGPDQDPGLRLSPDRGAYVYYTSGSTGRRKGVLDTHRGVLHNVMRYTESLRIGPDDRMTLLQSPSFSGAVSSLFGALLNGAASFPFDVAADGVDRIAPWLRAHAITIYHSVPALFRTVAASGIELPALRLIRLEGDRTSPRDVELFRRRFPRAVLVNGLGLTECGLVRQLFVDAHTPVPGPVVPVGYPVPDMEVRLLDADGRDVGPGNVGEIAVRSRYLAAGYWRQPELTAERFRPDPAGGGVRVYRTGDLGRLRPDGCLEHLGRTDFLPKVRGAHVDVAEVEAALLTHESVAEAVVAVREDEPATARLVAYVVPAPGARPTVSALRRHLVLQLPPRLMPSDYVLLAALPLDPNGKVDRRGLPAPASRPDQDRPPVAPRTPVEERLAAIWAEALRRDRIGLEDDFFDLGGDSLQAAQITSRVQEEFGVELAVRDIFEAPTLAALAPRIASEPGAAPHDGEPAGNPATLESLLADRARRRPDTVVLVAPEGALLTSAALGRQIASVRRTLRALGIGRRSRVGVVLPHGPELVAALAAVAAAATAIPLNPAWRRPELEAYLRAASVDALLLWADGLAPAREAARALGIPVMEARPAPGRPVGAFTLHGAGVGPRVPDEPARSDDVALVMHTSGTTALPKRVPLTHANVVAGVTSLGSTLALGPTDRGLAVMPLFHIHGLMVALGSILTGGSLACPPAFDPTRFFEWVMALRPTWYSAVPAVHQAVVTQAALGPAGVPRGVLRLARSASAPLSPELAAEVEATWAVPVVEAYGMTEGTHQIASNPLPPGARKPGSVGLPAGAEVAIADETGGRLPPGEDGEILVRGPGLTGGYEGDPDATLAAFRDGWLRTGDLGHLDGEGYLFITGRLKDLINRGGEKIAPREIEQALARHPAVADSIAYAAPHPTLGEDVAAAVVLREGHPASERDIREFLDTQLAPVKVPPRIHILVELPRTPSGKVNRRELAAALERSVQPLAPAAASRPATPTEDVIASIWSRVLRRPPVGVEDDFFALGGNSLQATMIVSRIRQALGVDLPIAALFERRTVRELARAVGEIRLPGGAEAIAPSQPAPQYPVSFAQQRLWFLDQLAPGSAMYNVPLAINLRGPLDAEALRRSLEAVVARHEPLRTRLVAVGGEPVQLIDPAAHLPLPLVDLAALEGPAGARDVGRRLADEARRPFDLSRDLMLRATLFRLGSADHVLLLVAHHAATDGWSMGLMLDEVSALYAAHRQGTPARLPPLAVQYRDYAVWQRQRLRDELGRHLEWWRQCLAGVPPLLDLPADRPRPTVQTFAGARHSIPLAVPPERVRTLGGAAAASPFMVFLAGFLALLQRYTGRDDLVVGTPAAGRGRLETEALMGFFANTLALRVNVGGDPSFGELVARVREVVLAAQVHQDLPFEKLVEDLDPARTLAYMPLVQVTFAVDADAASRLRLPDLEAESVAVDPGTARFDLSMTVLERADGHTLAVEYRSDLFAPDTVARLLEHYGILLSLALEAPERRLSSLSVLGEEERRRLVVDWNATARPFPHDRAIPELFGRVVTRQPQAVAVADDHRVLTYAELDRETNRLAHHLQRLGVAPDAAVGVCLERSCDAVVACLGILKAGGAYVPLDPGYPRSRLAFMLEETRARAVVTRQGFLGILPATAARTVCLDSGAADLATEPDDAPQSAVTGEHLAYVMFTSGSTGRPKGVAVPHRAVARLVVNTDYVSLTPDDVVAQAANASFDAATFEVWGALLNGARLQILPTDALLAPAELAARLARHRITTLFLTTAVFNQMAREIPERLGELRHLLFGGETADAHAAARLLEHGFAGRLLHVYGPTETTTFATWDQVVAVPPGATTLPIGRPIANTEVYILDSRGDLVPVGVPGEIYIGGPGLARGYVNRPDLTAERFVPHPFSADPAARLYRTGDRARYLADGRIDFLGRLDEQVKIRGHRIEPGEIEAALAQHPGVREAAVVARELPGRGSVLVTYVVPDGRGPAGAHELREALAERLPAYMLPAAFVMLERLPLTGNGKVDRGALPPPDAGRLLSPRSAIAPRTPTEQALAQIWAEVLGLERVGVEDGFFDLGGHSLLATRVLSRIRAVLGVDVPLRALFDGPTVAQLAIRADEARARQSASPPGGIRPGRREATTPLSFAQLRFWVLQELNPQAVPFNVFVAWRLRGPLDEPALRASLQAVVDRHEVLRSCFVAGPAGDPVQQVAPEAPVDLVVADVSHLPVAAREEEARRLATDTWQRPFDLGRGPLLRPLLVRLDPGDHVLLLATHHIAVDGWSLDVLHRDLARAYGAVRRGGRAELPELPVQYGDFTLWQREQLERGELDAQLAYWRQRLAGPLPEQLLPTDWPRPVSKTYRGARVSLLLSPALAAAVRDLGAREDASLFMVLLAALQVLLHRYSGEDDIVVGAPVDGHRRPELEGLAGCLLNLLAFRTNLGGNPSFREALARVREVALSAYGNQDVPFEKVLEALYPDRGRARTPVFQVLLNMHEFERQLDLPGLAVEPFEMPRPESLFDLTLYFRTERTGIHLTAAYDTDLFTETRITDLLAQVEHLLEQVTADPERRIDDLSLLTPRARAVLPDTTASLDGSWKGPVHDRLTLHATATPGRLAIEASGERWTYGELELRSNQLAHALRAAGLTAEDVLAIHAHRSAPLVWAILGALKAGIAYMILDPAYPERRLVDYVEMAGPRAWIEIDGAPPLPASLAARARAAVWWGRLGPGPVADVLAGPPLDARAADPPGVEIGPDSLAFVQFTSGSTGRPRGVLGRHGPLSHFLPWQTEAFGLSAADRFSMASGLAHDPLQRDIFTALWVGGAVCIPDPAHMATPGWLSTWMSASGITVAMLTPAMAQLMAAPTGGAEDEGRVPSLRCVFLVGEALRRRDVSYLRRLGPAVEVVNLYGSTETQRAVGYVAVTREEAAMRKEVIPLGRGIPDVQLLVLGPAGQLAGIGELGEIFVRSPHLARGYLGESALTAERFVASPFTGRLDDRLYRTGDLGRYLPDGEVEFAGRRDTQIKLRGFRIELSEIEVTLGQHPAVREAAVAMRADGEGASELVAYIVPAHEPAPAVAELRRHTRDRLPDYMVPARWVVLSALPLTPNGKVDRDALPAPDRGRAEQEAPYVAPRTAIEARLAAIWAEVLKRDQVSAEDDFFDLGGDSLRATMVAARVRRAFGVELPLVALFEGRTVAKLAVAIAESVPRGSP